MKFNDWVKKYEKEAEELIILPGFSIYFEPDKGFFCWKVTGNYFEIDHTCTNDIYWAHNKCMAMAKECGCKILRTATFKDPSAYMRLTKATPTIFVGLKPNGNFYWIFEKQVS